VVEAKSEVRIEGSREVASVVYMLWMLSSSMRGCSHTKCVD
jgi:hypothetical protein